VTFVNNHENSTFLPCTATFHGGMITEPKRMGESGPRLSSLPAEFDDIVAWVAWLYYADQLTQSEVAEAVGLSRATVAKLLQEARERGAVSINLNTEAMSRTKLSRALAARYGLQAAHIIPTLKDVPLTERLGEAGARVLNELLTPGEIIGVAWGRSVYAVAAAMTMPRTGGPFTVVQVTGSSPGGTAEFSPELCSSLLATKLSARCANLLAPAVLSNARLRDELLAEPALVEQFRLIRAARTLLFGVGDIGPQSTARIAQLARPEVVDDYVANGAVAVILGRFVDAEGNPVAGELDNRMIGVTLEELRQMSGRICVAGDQNKIRPLLAALKGGFIQRLVTDAATADALMR
jgi:DNA-binding transcriptional regulator LsrR (DeoR family)